jgi:hypothetical protein
MSVLSSGMYSQYSTFTIGLSVVPRFGYHKLTAYDAAKAGILAEEEIDSARAMFTVAKI